MENINTDDWVLRVNEIGGALSVALNYEYKCMLAELCCLLLCPIFMDLYFKDQQDQE